MSATLVQLCVCADCSNPARNGFLCDSCGWALQADLRGIPEILGDLLVTFTRQDVGDPQPSGRVEVEPPLLFRPHAAEADADLNGVLYAWVKHLAGVLGLTMRDVLPARRDMSVAPGPWLDDRHEWVERSGFPGNDSVELALWLERHQNTIRIDPRAGEMADEIADAVERVRRATDRPSTRVYLGACDCTAAGERQNDLYAHPDAARVTCRECNTVWDVAERRAWLLEHSAGALVTAEMATRALPSLLGYDLTLDLIGRLVRREGLERHPPAATDPHRRPRYRVGDIALMVAARKARAEARSAGLADARPPIEDLPPELAALFTAARAAAAAFNAAEQIVRDA